MEDLSSTPRTAGRLVSAPMLFCILLFQIKIHEVRKKVLYPLAVQVQITKEQSYENKLLKTDSKPECSQLCLHFLQWTNITCCQSAAIPSRNRPFSYAEAYYFQGVAVVLQQTVMNFPLDIRVHLMEAKPDPN